MSEDEDIFDHPDLRDPSWGKLVQREKRRGFWRRNRARTAIWLALIIAVPALMLYAIVRDSTPIKVPERPVPPPTAEPSSNAAPVRREVNLALPFAGTPAADWADGEAGMVMPPVAAVNGFSAAKVTEALASARQAFVAGYLDPVVIQDNKVDAYAALFAQDVRDEVRTKPEHHIRIAPGYLLMLRPAKVKGEFTVESGKKDEIVIRANFSVVYAFQPDGSAILSDPMDILTVYRANMQYIFRDGTTFAPSSKGLWPGGGQGHVYSVGCAASKQGMLAPAYSDRSGGTGAGTSAEDRDRMFDPAKPMPTGGNC